MTRNKFQIENDQLTGRGLSFDVAAIVSAQAPADVDRRQTLVELTEAIYLQGRSAVLPSWDDRFDLSLTVDALRALAVLVGANPAGDRHRRAADIIARMLQEQGA
jgi:hypothetical protein